MSRHLQLRGAVVLAALAVAAPIFAPAPAFAQAPDAAAEVGADSLPKDAAAKVEQHIKTLHDQLAITAAEQPQWDEFAKVMRANAAQMNQVSSDRGAKMPGMTAADSMESYAQLAQVHAAAMQKLSGAFRALYDAFPEAQKKLADKVFLASAGPGAHRR